MSENIRRLRMLALKTQFLEPLPGVHSAPMIEAANSGFTAQEIGFAAIRALLTQAGVWAMTMTAKDGIIVDEKDLQVMLLEEFAALQASPSVQAAIRKVKGES